MQQKQILLDCERMKYPNTGLYHYCLQLAKALQQALETSQTESLCLFANEAAATAISPSIAHITPASWHKWFLPFADKFDVWHATHQSTDYFPTNTKTPIVLTIHDLNFLYDAHKNPQKRKRYLQALQQKIDASKHIVAISQHVKNDILQHCNVGDKPISVIYNGCNISNDIIAKKPAGIASQPFLYSIGTIAEKKNFHVLPALLVNNNYQLIISGITQSDAYQQQIIDSAKQLGVADRLVFTGAISEAEKYWYYQHCEAFVFPSIAEGFGLPVIEAMYFGKPVILSTHTSLPEIGGPHAYYFQDFEPATMQQTLFNSLAHYYQQNPQAAIKKWASQFTWQQAAAQYLNVYRTLKQA
jgi:glycosyltransferase involved in cell wall biosynthesis